MALNWHKQYYQYKKYFDNIIALYKKRSDIKMFLELLLSLITISVFGLFALKPTFFTISQLLKNIETKKETIAQMDQKIADLATAQKNYDREFTQISLLETAVPNTPSPNTFIRQIEGIAQQNSVDILGASVGESVLAGEIKEGSQSINVSVSVSGNYSALVDFLSDFQNLRRPSLIETFSLSLASQEDVSKIVLVVAAKVPFVSQ